MLNKNGIRVEFKKKIPRLQKLDIPRLPMVKIVKGEEFFEIPMFDPLLNTLLLENYEIVK